MIEFKRLKYKNFMSVGDHPVEIHFDDFSSMLTTGQNGSGKSSIIEALVFGLFNKSFRKVNKPKLINSINNKDCVVEVEFETRGTNYLVRRGMKPARFEIYENGELIEQNAKNTDYQKMFENQILRINYKTFIQVVILSTSNYTPFMVLPQQQRREVIEDLLDINIFTWMNQILKDRVRASKEEAKTLANDLEMLKVKEDHLAKQIDFIEKQNQEKIDKIKEEGREKRKQVDTIDEQIENIQQALEEKRKEYQEEADKLSKKNLADTLFSNIKQKKGKFEKEKTFFSENENCPTCSQEINPEFRDQMIKNKERKIEELDNGLSELQQKLNEYQEIQKEVQEKSKEIQEKETEINSQREKRKFLVSDLKNLKQELETAEQKARETTEEEKKELEKKQKEKQELEDKKQEVDEEREFQDIAARLLRDDGIKTTIIKKYLPLINQKILEYLDKFDFHVAFRLDEEFNEQILARYYDQFEYGSFSAGEQQRIDLALLFAWREVARAKNSVSTNLLLLDEILDSSCDQQAIDSLLGILNDLSNKGTKVFVVSHRSADTFYDRFEGHMKMEKNSKGFSQIAYLEKE